MAANGTGSLVFIDDVTADKRSRMNSEVTGQDNLDVISTIYNTHVSSYYLQTLKKEKKNQ